MGGGGRNPYIFSSQQREEPFRQFAEELGALPDRARGPEHHQPCRKRLKYVTDFSILYFGMLSKLKSIDLTSDMKLLRVGVIISVLVTWATLTEISPKRFVDDNTITSIMGRKSSIIVDLGDSTICNSLISAEKVLHGRGQFEGSTPKTNLSRCTEKKVIVYIFAMGNNLYLACWGWSAAALMSPCPGGRTSKLESNSNQVQFPQFFFSRIGHRTRSNLQTQCLGIFDMFDPGLLQ